MKEGLILCHVLTIHSCRCSRNPLAFSNRAMAYIKLKEFVRAEEDASMALKLDPTHVKVCLCP